MRKIHKYFLKSFQSPSSFELSVLYVLLGIYLGLGTDSVVQFGWISFVIYSISCVAIFACFRLINFLIMLYRQNISKKDWIKWGQLGFISFVLLLLFYTNLGLCVRLLISRHAMLEEVEMAFSMNADSQKILFETGPVPTGMFSVRIYRVDSENRTVWFHTEDGGALFWVPSLMGGIVYCEKKRPAEIGETSYQHLWGPWWRWAQDI